MPFTHVSDETREALEHVVGIEYVDVSASDTAYFELFQELWQSGDDFLIIEQDIVIRPDTIGSFKRCTAAWCAAPYPYLGSETYAGLGCVRFRAALTRELPIIPNYVATHRYPKHTPRHWCVLDAAVQRELWKNGRHACTRHPAVGHLHSTPTHGCC